MVASAGATVVDLGIARDDLDDVVSRIREGIAESDAVIVAGGVSVGPYDVVKRAFDIVGRVDLWRVAVQPGKPFVFGVAPDGDREVALFGLPGNPVSGFVTFELFVRPAIRRLAGHHWLLRPTDAGVLTESVTKAPGRRAYLRVVADRDADDRPVRDAAGPGPRAARRRPGQSRPDRACRGRRPGGRPRSRRRTAGRVRRSPSCGWIAREPRSRTGRRRDVGCRTRIGALEAVDGPQATASRRAAPPDPRRPDRPATDGRRQRQAADGPARRRRGVRRLQRGDAQPDRRRGDSQGRRADRRRAGRGDGRQADERAHPALPSDRPDRPPRPGRPRPHRGRAPDPVRGGDRGFDRRRDGGPDRGVRRGAHRLRYGQGRGARRGDPIGAARLEDRWQERRVGPPRRSNRRRPGSAPASKARPGDRTAGRIHGRKKGGG